jgi:FMN-dependent NADH-azoreductase
MKQILIVESSPMGGESVTRQMTQRVEERLRVAYPQARIVRRDLAESPAPHLAEAAVRSFRSGGKGGASTLSDELTDELLASDAVVIASPTWNFGIPSSMKAWIDHVVRAGKTFSYSEKGPAGLAAGKRAILIMSSGGVYSSGPMKSWDFVEPYLRQILGFIGITDIQSVRVEGVSIPGLKEAAIPNAVKAVDELVL